MKKSFITAIALGLVFAFGANAQIISGSKQVAKGTKKATIKGAKATNKGVRHAYGTTKKVTGIAYGKTKSATVKSAKATKRIVKKVF
jgi:hypothetical protein